MCWSRVRGYLTLAEHLYHHGPQFSGGWNFGPYYHDAKPVQWIVEYVASRWKTSPSATAPRWQIDSGVHPHEANMLTLDWTKASQQSRLAARALPIAGARYDA